MMKRTLNTMSLIIATFVAMPTAQAAPPTAELTVHGEMVVPSCTVAAADDGVYDLGKISATLIKPNADTQLTPMSKHWTISCDADTYLTLTPTDHRADSSTNSASGYYGLGNINGSGKIGTYYVEMANGTVDGTPTSLFTTSSSAIAPKATTYIHKGYVSGWAAGTNRLQNGRVFGANLIIYPTLASSSMMQGSITEDSNIDGAMTLNFAFGI